MQVHEDGEVHLSLQTGGGADCHARALALDAQVGLCQASQCVALLLLLPGTSGVGLPVAEIPLAQKHTHIGCQLKSQQAEWEGME